MAETDQERTESATPQRREDARKEGKVAKSREFNSAIALMLAALLINASAPHIGNGAQDIFARTADWMALKELDPVSAAAILREVLQLLMGILAPVLLGLCAIGIATSVVQTQGIFSWNPIEPKLSHLNPISGFARIFGWRAVASTFTQGLRVSVVAAVGYLLFSGVWVQIVSLIGQSPQDIVSVTRSMALRLLGLLGLAYLLIAIIDYAFQWWELEKSLKMTKQQIKEESRNTDGDPMVRMRIRQIMRDMSRRKMMGDIPKSDVVIVNPTMRAVALRFEMDVDDAPVVVAMGERKVAERIRAIAEEHGVPIVSNRTLAIALLKTAKVGYPIPVALYDAVAAILVSIYRSRYGGFGPPPPGAM